MYRTAPQEVEDQPDFLNAVAVCETEESPEDIWNVLKSVENQLAKDPPYRLGPRTIDLDLLLYDNQVIDNGDLIIPHPKMHQRRFVLEPLCELIDPSAPHPALGMGWADLIKNVRDQGCESASVLLP